MQLKRYDVLLSYPKRPSTLSLTDNNGTEVYSSILIENFTTTENDSRTTIPFSTYSASGEATGKLLYVNYGRESDFKYLDDSNISCTGMIVIVRYGKIPEGTKVSVEFMYSISIHFTEGGCLCVVEGRGGGGWGGSS